MISPVLLLLALLASPTFAKPVVYADGLVDEHHELAAEMNTTSCTITTSTTLSSSTLYNNWMTYPSSSSLLPYPTPVSSSSAVLPTLSTIGSTSQSPSQSPSSSCSAGVAPPAPTQPDIIAGCSIWHIAEPGEFCYEVAQAFGISVDTFMAWNPAVIPPNCQSMLAGDAYCVGTCGGTPTASASYSYTSTLPSITTITTSSSSVPTVASSSAVGSYPTALPTTFSPSDVYHTYLGDGSVTDGWPSMNQWLNFTYLFNYNIANMKVGCQQWAVQDDTDQEVDEMRDSIHKVASLTGIDARFILAIIMQESLGCVRVITTAYSHSNPGLMQSYNGSGTCNSNIPALSSQGVVQIPCPKHETYQMILDGTNGTQSGDGLRQNFAEQGDTGAQGYYRTARIYNGGGIDPSGDLGKGCCTASYVSDIANRLMGWAYSPRNYTY